MSINNWNILRTTFDFADKNQEKLLISVNGQTLTYGSFSEDVLSIGAMLKKFGVKKNEMVALILPNTPSWYSFFWAIVNIGAHPIPLDPQTGEWELKQIFKITGIRICFAASKYRGNSIKESLRKMHGECGIPEKVIMADECSDEGPFTSIGNIEKSSAKPFSQYLFSVEYTDTLMYACTSGTTGNSKIINVEHGGFHKAMKDMAEYLELSSDDRMLLGMPLYHQGGFGMGVQMLVQGGSVYYQTKFDPVQFLKTIQDEKITIVQLTPTLAKILLTVPNLSDFDLSSLKISYFAGEVLPDDVAKEFYLNHNIRVVNIIGSSETGTMVIWDSKYDRDVDVNCFKPLPFTRSKIIDANEKELSEGETGIIFIQTDAVLKDYFSNQNESAAKIRVIDGKRWFNTGDLGKQLDNGRIKFIGRAKRIIKRGSNLVYPEEVESFLLTNPQIRAVAVVSEKQDVFGEMIVAFVQLVSNAATTRGDLLKYCKGQLSSYKIPDKFIIVEEIPADIGKVQFKYLRDQKGNKI